MKNKFVLLLCLLVSSGVVPAFSQTAENVPEEDVLEICDFDNAVSSYSSPFALSWALDAPLLVAGAGFNATWILFSDPMIQSAKERYEGVVFDPSSINFLDRLFVNSYSKVLDRVSDATLLGEGVLVTAAAFGVEAIMGKLNLDDCLKVGTMYLESLLVGYGFGEIVNRVVARPRPYVYASGMDVSQCKDDDLVSFPSGHSYLAAMTATYTTYVFSTYFSDSAWKIPVAAASWGFAGATMILRVASGNHFITDVLAGCALGCAVGFLVPWSHKLVADMGKNNAVALKGISILPTGISVSLALGRN